ncbi:nuclease SbcCD subunit C-like isoform X2 [Cyclopterus lumpus]|uniref:nuclease SbcCD subunit C-like isoform X2 n=2 Tax=Cyclopterus lumpus TaxID=8103 RepID=UPI0014865467|nr:nuclease SbcCD subunit C-like isoform X2 [Cyclopterus lumpus]
MHCNSADITKMKDSRTLPGIKTSEKRTEESAAKQAKASYGQPPAGQQPPSKPGLSLEKRMEQEERRRHVLANEHNRLTFAVNEEEAKLKQLQESLKAMSVQPTNHNNEDARKQRMRQLENDKDKMKIKIIPATEIQMAFQHIRERLQQEVRGAFMVLDQKQQAVAAGQAEVDRATKQFRSAAAAADSALSSMEDGTMRRKREMESELFKLSAEEKELKRQMESSKHLNPAGQSRQKERQIKEGDPHSVPVTDHQCVDACGASQSDVKLVEDMEALKEALGSIEEVQELVDKVPSQTASMEQLFAEIAQYEDFSRQEAKTVAELELQYAELQFSAQPAATRVEMQAELKQEVVRVQRLQAELKQSQDLLDTVELQVNNLYIRMSCVSVEGLPSAPSVDCPDRLGDVRARMPTLLRRASEQEAESSGLDQEKTGGSSVSGRRSP